MKNITENRLLFIDTETGGIIPTKHSLLSIGLVAWDVNDGIIGSDEIFVKNKRYFFTKEAQRINKFEKSKHNEKAIPHDEVIKRLREFCNKHFKSDTLVPLAGHNTQFDVGFVKVFLNKNNVSYNNLFSHRILDTYSILRYLVYAGKIDDNISSSAKAFQYFGIKVNERHSALGDALATVELFEKLLELQN